MEVQEGRPPVSGQNTAIADSAEHIDVNALHLLLGVTLVVLRSTGDKLGPVAWKLKYISTDCALKCFTTLVLTRILVSDVIGL